MTSRALAAGFEEVKEEPVKPTETDAFKRADAALRAKWEREREGKPPPRKMEFTVTFECTFETWESVMLALKGFPLENRRYRQYEIPEGR